MHTVKFGALKMCSAVLTVKFGALKMCSKMVAVLTKLQNLPNPITLVPPHVNVQLVVAILNPVTFYRF